MQGKAYVGHFENGRFYSFGQVVELPERRLVIITMLDDMPETHAERLAAWEDFKRMIKIPDNENHLPDDDVFR